MTKRNRNISQWRRPARLVYGAWAAVLVLSAGVSGCGQAQSSQDEKEAWPLDGFVSIERLPLPEDPHLLKGREIWGGTCQGCHALGVAGAPKVTDIQAWAPRIAQGVDVLYTHATEGFFGPDGSMMPARGGNDALTDDDIRAAVDFMISNSQ